MAKKVDNGDRKTAHLSVPLAAGDAATAPAAVGRVRVPIAENTVGWTAMADITDAIVVGEAVMQAIGKAMMTTYGALMNPSYEVGSVKVFLAKDHKPVFVNFLASGTKFLDAMLADALYKNKDYAEIFDLEVQAARPMSKKRIAKILNMVYLMVMSSGSLPNQKDTGDLPGLVKNILNEEGAHAFRDETGKPIIVEKRSTFAHMISSYSTSAFPAVMIASLDPELLSEITQSRVRKGTAGCKSLAIAKIAIDIIEESGVREFDGKKNDTIRLLAETYSRGDKLAFHPLFSKISTIVKGLNNWVLEGCVTMLGPDRLMAFEAAIKRHRALKSIKFDLVKTVTGVKWDMTLEADALATDISFETLHAHIRAIPVVSFARFMAG
jgi:hypothetical protein